MNILVSTDGGSRGNPGPSAIGVYITNDKGEEIVRIGKRIGHATNNIAEYSAILEAITWLGDNKDKLGKDSKIFFSMDSELATSQISGVYKVKNENIRDLLFKIRVKEKELGFPVTYKHIKREENKEADKLVNLALDNKI